VVLVISAWNYPIYTALPLVAYAIAAGNAVILKPSEVASYTSNWLLKLFNKYMDSSRYFDIQGFIELLREKSKLLKPSLKFPLTSFVSPDQLPQEDWSPRKQPTILLHAFWNSVASVLSLSMNLLKSKAQS
jgi:hypothetical protein